MKSLALRQELWCRGNVRAREGGGTWPFTEIRTTTRQPRTFRGLQQSSSTRGGMQSPDRIKLRRKKCRNWSPLVDIDEREFLHSDHGLESRSTNTLVISSQGL